LNGRASGLFRGSELPRLLILLTVTVLGWTGVLIYINLPNHKTAPPPTVATAPPKVEPETSPIFMVVRDKQPMSFHDGAAYAKLLARARSTPPAELAEQARHNLFFTHLWENPERYRGVPVHLDGTALRVLSYEVNPELSPKGQLNEAWVITEESGHNPYVVVFEDMPPGFPSGAHLSERVTFDGYFLKLMAYRTVDDKTRAAPLLVGRLRWFPHEESRPGAATGMKSLWWTILPLAALTLYTLFRWVFQLPRLIRGPFAPTQTTHPLGTPTEEIAPEALSQWLEQASETEPADEDSFRSAD
jgi:hypothetical protein